MWHSSLLLMASLGLSAAELVEMHERADVLNTTLDASARNSVGYNYGAYVERVNLQNCPRMSSYTPHFYKGFVANTRARKEMSWDVNRLAFRVLMQGLGQISSTAGPAIATRDQLYHTWEMLHMYPIDTDIRVKEPGRLRLHLSDGMPQVYIPLYMADAAIGDAYMLHLYPETSFLSSPASYDFVDGVLLARNGKHGLYSVELNIAGLIKDLNNFQAPNYKKYVQDHGRIFLENHSTRDPWYLDDERQLSLKATTKGGANEFICHTTPGQIAYTWTQFQQILKSQFRWL